MSGPSKTVVFADSLGSALWEYTSLNKEAWGNFSASGISKNKTDPFDLTYEHVFFSTKLTEEQNKQVVDNLVSILKSINATNIKANIINPSNITQQINASYQISQISPDKVDSLSTTIAGVCEELINKLASLSTDPIVSAKPSVATEPVKPSVASEPVKSSVAPEPVKPSVVPASNKPSVVPETAKPSVVSEPAKPSVSDKKGIVNSTIIGICENLIKDLNAIH